MPGIFVTRGARLTIPSFTLTEEPDGSVTGPESITVHLSYEMYPQWLQVAVEHAERAVEASKVVDHEWAVEPENSIARGEALEVEMRAAMQAIVATAAVFEGLFGMLADLAPVQASLQASWQTNRTRRPARIAEALKQAFKIPASEFKKVKLLLHQIFDFRDMAMHPTSAAGPAIEHPRLATGVERRFAIFRAENALTATEAAIAIVSGLLEVPKPKHRKLVEHCGFGKEWVEPIKDAWKARHGSAKDEKKQGIADA